VKTAAGVNLSPSQNALVSSVLELFKGNATKERLQLWDSDGEFEDPLCIAKGRQQYEGQWVSSIASSTELDIEILSMV
jgi:hypothetical protein